MVGFLRCCVVGLFSLSVLAVEAAPRQKPVVRPASTQDQFKKGSTTLDIDRHWGEVIDIPSSGYTSSARVNLPVVQKSKYGWGRVKAIAKFAIKANPARYIATAAVLYAVDQIPTAKVKDGQLYSDGSPGETTYRWGVQAGGSNCGFSVYCSSAQAQSDAYVSSYNSANAVISYSARVNRVDVTGQYNATAYYDLKMGASASWSNNAYSQLLVAIAFCGLAKGPCPDSPDVPFSESDYDSLVEGLPDAPQSAWDEFGPDLLADVPASFDGPDGSEFTGPTSMQGSPTVTTSTDPATGNTTVTESIPSFNFDYSSDPLSITSNTTVTNNTYENGVKTSTSTTVQASPSTGVETLPEVPTDCEFMPTVCSFIDWVKDPFQEEEPDLSDLIADDDFQKNIDFSSNASCPAPSIMATGQGSFEFSWQPACQWAGMVKPFIIIAALLAAIFINLGAIRGPN